MSSHTHNRIPKGQGKTIKYLEENTRKYFYDL